MPLTELPFGFLGRVYRSPMPFGPYDPRGTVYDQLYAEHIGVIVLLTSDAECLYKAGRNLRALYLQDGFQVLYLPTPDFGVPSIADLEQAVHQTMDYAQEGHHIVIHCSAGIGRTGLFMAWLAKRHWGLSGEEAIHWVRRFIPSAVETPEQQQFVLQEGGTYRDGDKV
jgi:protein-tyrosine phosphatase